MADTYVLECDGNGNTRIFDGALEVVSLGFYVYNCYSFNILTFYHSVKQHAVFNIELKTFRRLKRHFDGVLRSPISFLSSFFLSVR